MDRSRRAGVAATLAAAGVLAGCGGPTRQQKAAYAEAAKHYVPPAVTSRLDYGSIVERRFRALDHNGDDFITPNELPRPNDPRIMQLDRNGDGRVSEPEFSEGMMARFDRNDLNKDGSVTTDEMQAAKRVPGANGQVAGNASPPVAATGSTPPAVSVKR